MFVFDYEPSFLMFAVDESTITENLKKIYNKVMSFQQQKNFQDADNVLNDLSEVVKAQLLLLQQKRRFAAAKLLTNFIVMHVRQKLDSLKSTQQRNQENTEFSKKWNGLVFKLTTNVDLKAWGLLMFGVFLMKDAGTEIGFTLGVLAFAFALVTMGTTKYYNDSLNKRPSDDQIDKVKNNLKNFLKTKEIIKDTTKLTIKPPIYKENMLIYILEQTNNLTNEKIQYQAKQIEKAFFPHYIVATTHNNDIIILMPARPVNGSNSWAALLTDMHNASVCVKHAMPGKNSIAL